MKRSFDMVVSFIFFILLLPIFIAFFFWVILDSPGGAFYKQKRVGKNGKDFSLLKFRTMYTGSDFKGLLTIGTHDHRITGAGKFLRRYKLDELPQLYNVFKGDMSIVGPRPEVRKYVDLYDSEQLKVLNVRPGLTDYASLEYIDENKILGKSHDPEQVYIHEIMPEKLKLNLKYIKEQSFIVDIKIILRTLTSIFTS